MLNAVHKAQSTVLPYSATSIDVEEVMHYLDNCYVRS